MTALCLFKLFYVCVLFTTVYSVGLNSHHREHLQSHVEGELDLSAMSQEQLKFLYFQSHDAEGNNKLDGLELIQALLHFHEEESNFHALPSTIFTDAELSALVDPLLESTDKNMDGFIDYPEFIAGPGIINY